VINNELENKHENINFVSANTYSTLSGSTSPNNATENNDEL